MSKTLKTLIIILLILIVVLGGGLTYLYVKNVALNNQKVTQTVVKEKDEDTKELESINTEIKNSDDFDLTDISSVSSELDQIDMSGL